MRGCILWLCLFAGVALSVPGQAREAAGVVLLVRGEFHAEREGGETRTLRRRSPIFEGDTLVTGTRSHAQVRLTDGTLIALRPETRLRIEAYRRDPENGDERNFTRLLQGGFRTLTGLISKRNPGAYRVETPVATIGVRGTHYEAVLHDGLEIGAYAGKVEVVSEGGALLLGPGQAFRFARITAPDRPPVGLLKPPESLGRPVLGPEGLSAGERAARAGKSPRRHLARITKIKRELQGETKGLQSPSRSLPRPFLLPSLLAPENLTLVPGTESAQNLPIVDLRFTATEWDRLWSEKRFGVVLWPRAVPRLEGGRAIENLANDRPVITSTGYPPFLPDFQNALIRDVFRRGQAQVSTSQVISVDATHPVHWGVWNGTADPVLDLVDATDPTRILPVPERVLWATVLPTRPDVLAGRTGAVTLSSVQGALGASSAGPFDATSLAVSMNVDFSSGKITNGTLNLTLSPDLWNVDFEGDIRGSFADLRLLSTSRVNGVSPVDGVMGGVFTGSNGEALLQAFDLKDANDPSRWAQGLVLVK